MTEFACNYALLRFLPYRDGGEFVNVGVVLACAGTRYFDFRTETEGWDRVIHFFPEIEKSYYCDGLNHAKMELQRWRNMAAHMADGGKEKPEALFNRAFGELIRHRQSIFYFSEPRTILASEPELTLNQLFERHVHRMGTAEPIARS